MTDQRPLGYDTVREEFSWESARDRLAGLPGGRGLNIAHEAVDRHIDEGRGDRVALRCVSAKGDVTDVSYAELAEASNRFANVLSTLGVGKGDRVMSLLGRTADQYVAALGTLKNASVFSPLFSSFGPEPIHERLRLSRARVLVTTPQLYRRKVAGIRGDLDHLEHVLLVPGPSGATGDAGDGVRDLRALLDETDASFEIPRRTRRTWLCCTSPAARPGSPRAPSMCTRRSSPTT